MQQTNIQRTARGFLQALGVCGMAALMAVSPITMAQGAAWPPPVVKILVPLGPGGANDVVARLLAQHLGEKYKTSFVVENRVGAGGAVAMAALAKSPPDGTTFGIVSTATNAILPSLRKNLPYDAEKDLALVALITNYPLVVVVNPSVPATTLADFVAYAKSNPEKLTFGSGGVGTAVHLAGEVLNSTAQIKARHIPYKGTSEYVAALLGGHIDYAVDALINVAEPIRSGKLRAVAVTSAQRFPELPQIPTVAETYPGFVAVPWGGLAAPARTPATIVNAVSNEVRQFLEMPQIKARLIQLWAVPDWKSSDDFKAYVKSEREAYAKVIKQSGTTDE